MGHRWIASLVVLLLVGASGCFKRSDPDAVVPGPSSGALPPPSDSVFAGDDDDSAEVSATVGFNDSSEQAAAVLAKVAPSLDADAPVAGYVVGPTLLDELYGVEHWTLSLENGEDVWLFANLFESAEIERNMRRFFKSGKIPSGSPTEQLGFVGLRATPDDPLVLADERALKSVRAQGYWQERAVEGLILDATCEAWPDERYLLVAVHAPRGSFDLAKVRPAIEAIAACE